ncbi:unnamed protein product [marine sediment metagenome]|uniref:Uncharacterized protein n=1 Tax=marine sediment metagenome TaxID=412755 RepID=X1V7U5_9ZZZZ
MVRRHDIEVRVLIGVTLGEEAESFILHHLNHAVADGRDGCGANVRELYSEPGHPVKGASS